MNYILLFPDSEDEDDHEDWSQDTTYAHVCPIEVKVIWSSKCKSKEFETPSEMLYFCFYAINSFFPHILIVQFFPIILIFIPADTKIQGLISIGGFLRGGGSWDFIGQLIFDGACI